MVAQIEIGDKTAGKFKAYLGDGAQGAADTYGWFFLPEDLIIAIATPAQVASIVPRDKNLCVQVGSFVASVTMRNILVSAVGASAALTQLNLLKVALYEWATGYVGAGDTKGELLTFQAYDNGGNEWTTLPTWAAPTTCSTWYTKVIDPIQVVPQPNGDFLIPRLTLNCYRDVSA